MVYPVPQNVSAQSIQWLLCLLYMLKLELKYCMLQHPSSQVSYLDTCIMIPVHTTNCPVIFVLWYVQFRNKLLPRNSTGSQSHCLLYAQADALYLKLVQQNSNVIYNKKQIAYYSTGSLGVND